MSSGHLIDIQILTFCVQVKDVSGEQEIVFSKKFGNEE